MPAKSHGCSGLPIYAIWASMRRRCQYRLDRAYKYYGGRGITVCDRWNSFENFYADMGDRPEGKSLDRIDNNGPYSPDNCRWATQKTQNRNNRRAKEIEINGERRCIAEWLEKNGISYDVYKKRLKSGWAIEKSLLTPPGNGPSRLTPEQVFAIRADKRLQREIADEYGIARSAVSAIKRGVNWRYL